MSGTQPDPNPFSREAAEPGDGLGSGPNRFETLADGSTPQSSPAAQSSEPNPAGQSPADAGPPAYPTNPSSSSPTTFPSYARDAGGPTPYADPPPQDEAYDAFRGYQESTYRHAGQGVQPYSNYPQSGYPQAGPNYPQPGPTYPQPSPYGQPYGAYAPRPGLPNSPYSVPALALGVASFVSCGLTGPVGLGLGVAALKQIDAEPQRFGGRGMAIAGIITGSLGTLFMLVWILSALAS